MKKLIPEARAERLALKNAINRCHNKNHQSYSNYGARGIFVCDEWRRSFIAFYEHIGAKPTGKFDLDRINNDCGYVPGNVRWSTRSENARNKRKLSISSKTAIKLGYSCVTEAAEKLGISKALFIYRAKALIPDDLIGLPPRSEKLLSVNKHKYNYKYKTSSGMSLQDACKITGVKESCAFKRVIAYGWDIDTACGL